VSTGRRFKTRTDHRVVDPLVNRICRLREAAPIKLRRHVAPFVGNQCWLFLAAKGCSTIWRGNRPSFPSDVFADPVLGGSQATRRSRQIALKSQPLKRSAVQPPLGDQATFQGAACAGLWGDRGSITSIVSTGAAECHQRAFPDLASSFAPRLTGST